MYSATETFHGVLLYSDFGVIKDFGKTKINDL